MKQSESIQALAMALCEAQKEMGGVVKDASNPFFNSKYGDLTSVVKAIKEPFATNGLAYTQFPYSTERGVGVTTRLMHVSGEWLESEFVLPLTKNDPQAAGSALTYARRYALQAMAGIPTADDDAEAAMLRGDDKRYINSVQGGEIKALIEQTKSDRDSFCKAMKVEDIAEITVANFPTAIRKLKEKLARTPKESAAA